MFIFLTFGCTVHRKDVKNNYVTEFKYRYFQESLKKGFNNNVEIIKLFEIDHSGYTEPILSDESYNLINKLARKANEIMVQDSLRFIGRRAQGGIGKRVFSKCLSDFNSKWLDSIAKDEYNNYEKTKKLKM